MKIGHASIDERNRAAGGTAGNQTGREVCIREWYSKPWEFLLRFPDSSIADKAASACEAGCKNLHIGYDQYQRNTAHDAAKAVKYDLAKIKVDCETDCSAFVTLCYIAAGVTALEYTGNAPTTSTMRTAFNKAGFVTYTERKYLTGTEYLRRGDILVRPGSHTVMVLEDGAKVEEQKALVQPGSNSDGMQVAKGFAKNKAGEYRTTTAVNMRRGAGKTWGIISVLRSGEKVHCFGYYNTVSNQPWLYVVADGAVGYVSAAYLSKVGG